MRNTGFVSGICCLTFFFLFTVIASGQTRVNSSGTGGIHTIQGKVYSPNGRPLDSSVTVRLESTSSGELSLMTDQSGTFVFQNLAPGNYSIVIEGGDNFETARESITIDQNLQPSGGIPIAPNPKTFNVPVYLQLKRNAQIKNSVVNAKFADIPKESLDHYQKGIDLERNNKPDEAIVQFNIALISYPKFSECYVEIGKIDLTHSKLDEAATAFRKAIQIDPQNFDAHVNLGITLLNSKNPDEAEKEFVTAAFINKAAVTPHYYIGRIYTEKHQYDIAQKAFETAETLPGGDNFPLLHRYLGGIYVAKGLTKEAITELDRYLQLAPDAKDADKIRQTIAGLKAKPEKLNVVS